MLQVTCAIIIDGSRVLCTQRGPTMSLAGEWEFPGGKIEPGETAAACIVREIEEELNLRIEIVVDGPSVFHPLAKGEMLELIPFVCRCSGGRLLLREHAAARWCTIEEMATLGWAQADEGILAWWREVGEDLQATAFPEK